MSVSSQTQPHDEKSVLELELEQNREAPSLARAAIAGFSENRELDAATLATLTLLVSEVVTNAVIHPEVEAPGAIRLSARIAGGSIRVEVTDEGNGFTPSRATRQSQTAATACICSSSRRRRGAWSARTSTPSGSS